jgi:hypothetical protein
MESSGIGLCHPWQQRRKTMTEAVAEYLLGMLRTRSWALDDRPEPRRSHALMADLFTKGAGLRGEVCT